MANGSQVASTESAQRAIAEALSAIARGDRNGLSTLYRLTSAKLFGICLRICRSHTAAEDMLNEVYLSVWRRADTYDPDRARAMTWLCTIARNRSIDWVRSNSRPMESEDVLATFASDEPDAEQQLLAKQESVRLHHCLDELKDDQRNAIRTAFFDGLTYAELAERTKVPLGTMKTWIRRGLLKLKECLNGL